MTSPYNATSILGLLVGFTMTAATANAQSLDVQLHSISPSLTVNGTLNNGTTTSNVTSGVLTFTGSSNPALNFEAFCVEPNQSISVGQSLTFELAPLSTLTNSDMVARLFGAYIVSAKTNEVAAAIQWAIWEVTSENTASQSLGNGSVRITNTSSSTRALGNQYLANINNYSAANISYLTNANYQNMVAVVPEPTSLGLLALSGSLLLRRKR